MDFQREQILKNALEDKDVKVLVEHNQITAEILSKEVLSIYSYMINKKKCAGCTSLNNCQQDIIGSMPKINYNGNIYTEYVPCPYFQKEMDSNEKVANLLTLACNLDSIDSTSLFSDKPARKLIYNKMVNIYNTTMNGEYVKGIYLHGPYGCGKSYIMACFANKFAENGKKVVFAYYPDLIRQIKSSISTGGLESTVDILKEADVLFLDDFGGELNSSFIRDEFLGPILQYRMMAGLPVFMSSNYDIKSLTAHLAETKDENNIIKAGRIIERIVYMMKVVKLEDVNYRR